MPGKLAPYKKTVVAVVGALIAFATLVVRSPESLPTADEYLTGVIMLATALGVYVSTNTEG